MDMQHEKSIFSKYRFLNNKSHSKMQFKTIFNKLSKFCVTESKRVWNTKKMLINAKNVNH